MSGSKWCLSPILSAVVAVMLSGPTFSASGEHAGSQPHLRQSTTQKPTTQKPTALHAIAKTARDTKGSIFIETRSLDLATLQAADFGDAETTAAGH